MGRVLPPPLVTTGGWAPKIKNYPHFDSPLSLAEIESLVTDPVRVAANTFYPFMRYTQSWQPFRTGPKGKPKKKTRPIRFASRRDAYIFSYYRHLLSAPYEALLAQLGLSPAVIAYRKLRNPAGVGKSNIDFAKDAFDAISGFGTCGVACLDISSFFESLDHELLRSQWCRVLGVATLPQDHETVFRAVTRYAVVDREAVYRRLGFIADDPTTGVPGYTVAFDDMPRKLCGNARFREDICGKGGKSKSLIDVNRRPYGIPQGSPISDMLANIYLVDFDVAMDQYCRSKGGIYFRYSDDILLIIPGPSHEAEAARDFAMSEIGNHGAKIRIKPSKTAVIHYTPDPKGGQAFTHIAGEQGRNGLEYLGFRYDGKNVYLRDATLSRLYRKVSASVHWAVASHVARYPGKDAAFLNTSFDYADFFQRYGRVDDFDEASDYDTWTFWTYARKAMTAFGVRGKPIPRQLRLYKQIVRDRVHKKILAAA